MEGNGFQLSRVQGQPVSDHELLADLLRVAALLGGTFVSEQKYSLHWKYDARTISRRFGTWNAAIQKAGLAISNEVNISDERLFENGLLNLWQHYGRQPRQSELARAPSETSAGPTGGDLKLG